MRPNPKFHLERVPLSIAKKVAERELPQSKKAGHAGRPSMKKLEEDLTSANAAIGKKDRTSPFDIFRVDAGGTVVWLQSEATLEAAKARAEQFTAHSPGDYLVLNRKIWMQFRSFLVHVDGE